MFEQHVGRYPTTQEGLAALIAPPPGVADWKGPYLRANEVPLDAWGSPYVYAGDGEVMSWGPDKQPNTSDDIRNGAR